MTEADTELCRRVAELLGATDVGQLVHLSGGASRATSSLVADGRQLILQRQRSGAERSMEHEAEILRAAHRAGVPVPEVVASSGDATALGAPFLLVTAIEGETIARKLLRDEEFAEARRVLPAQLGRAAAAIHRIDPAGIPGLEQHDQVAYYRQVLDDLGQPHPAFELAFRWLEEHRPASPRTTLVHGDFRLGNVMVGGDGLRAILDWELAHLGDPLEDLGWLCVRAWRFGGPKPVAGMGDYEELFDAYEAASGTPIDREAARWWEVLGTLKWGIMCILQASSHLTGVARSHELAAIGRRVCENEYDLFLALEGSW